MLKIKQFIESDRGKDILTVLVVILVGTASFGLGRLSKDNASTGIKIEYPSQAANVLGAMDTNIDSNESTTPIVNFSQTSTTKTSKPTVGSTSSIGKAFFASKIGHKYYSIGCSGGKTIKQENRIYFSSEAEAQTAGFEKSSSCK